MNSPGTKTNSTRGSFPTIPSIPVGRYIDPEFFELEQKHIWCKTWLFAATADEIPEIGNYKLWERTGDSIVIVRGKDQAIRAFYNTCRHRGGALVKQGEGRCGALVCQFHGWSYGLDGKIRGIPGQHDFKDIIKTDYNLVEVRCEMWGNMVFVNKDPNAAPLAEFLGPIVKDFEDKSMDSRRVFKVLDSEMSCNWKIALDAFVESYHLPMTHPNTVSNYVDHRGSHIDLYDNGHSAMYSLQIKSDISAEHSPLNAEGSGSDQHRINRETIPQYTVFPNIQASTAELHFAFLMFWPTSINTTMVQVLFTAPEGYDDINSESAQQLILGLNAALQEDLDNLSWLQKSIESAANQAMPISYIERRIYHMAEAVDRCIGEENIPEHLRIPHTLEPFHVDPYAEGFVEKLAI